MKVLEQILNLFYPPLCACCEVRLTRQRPLLCLACLQQLSLLDVEGRCRICFSETDHERCERCMHRPVIIHTQMAACEASGPAKALLHLLHRGSIPAVASLMAYQWLKQGRQSPDFLIPLPVSFWQKQQHSFDVNLALAKELGRIFSVPTLSLLQRKFDRIYFLENGDFRCCFQRRKKCLEFLCDKHVLLIAPILDDESFRLAGSMLQVDFPSKISALAFILWENE